VCVLEREVVSAEALVRSLWERRAEEGVMAGGGGGGCGTSRASEGGVASSSLEEIDGVGTVKGELGVAGFLF
jgi:hypothetical protein